MGSPASARKAKPTAEDRAAAARLRAAWDAGKEERGLTQEIMAERLGNRTQGLVSQYLAGRIPLNYRALLAFCDALGILPETIRTDLPEQRLKGLHVAGVPSHEARLAPEKIVVTTRAINRILDRRKKGLVLDLTQPVHAELFAEVYAECLAMSEPDEADMLLVVVDLMAAREARNGSEGEQAGKPDRGGGRRARSG